MTRLAGMQGFATWTRAWFEGAFAQPTAVQTRGWEAIARGEHVLLVAPTGSGKTLAAFLHGIDRLTQKEPSAPGVRVLYVSPLKALVHDVDRNLRVPLAGIAARAPAGTRMPSVGVRTGDTTAKERRAQLREPPDILVTTPESLYLLLGSRAREGLRSIETVIIDEAHALADGKRGVHLALSLERLSSLLGREPQRIGLSATARPLAEVARFVGGDRSVQVIDTSEPPHIELTIEVPALDMTRPEETSLVRTPAAEPSASSERGMWSVIVPRLIELINTHTSTIVFVNSRGLCERLGHRINDTAGRALVRAHHGSIAHGERREIEEQLKRGELAGIVATSSLELGIDMDAVDLVVLVESPGSVARGLQRVGRAGHGVGRVSVGRMLPKHRGDLLEATVIARRMRRGELEALRVPENPLDVLAQQIVAITAVEPISVSALGALVRRAASYRQLPDSALHAVLDMLAGRFPSTAFADLRPRIVWDRELDVLSTRRGSGMVALVNGGTIPDRGTYGVYVGENGPRVGELDEEMVYETQAGETFTLGATTFRVEQITRDRVIVSPAPGELGKLPFWRGDGPGRPLELGQAIGTFTRELMERTPQAARAELAASYGLDQAAAENLCAFLEAQREATGTLPTDRAITIELGRDEAGDHRVCILTPLGRRVHTPWALAIAARSRALYGIAAQAMPGDDGIVLRFAGAEAEPDTALLLPDPDEVEQLVADQLPSTPLFAGAFRENAARALLLPRRRPGSRTPLWLQRKRSAELLASAQQHPDFPIVLETYRTCLRDTFDLPALRALLTAVAEKRVRVDIVHTDTASPLAQSLLLDYVGAFLYEGDAPLAERGARLLAVDSKLLRELLGQAALRTLLDSQVLTDVEASLQRLTPERKARDADELHDVLRTLGDLDLQELQARSHVDVAPALLQLEAQGRALRLLVRGQPRVIAAEDAALYRDALGVQLPSGLPAAWLGRVADPLGDLTRRFARTHGPFTSDELAARYAVPVAQADGWLTPLCAAGVLVHGELRPLGTTLEHCDSDVLRRLRLRTRAKLQAAIAPVPARTLARFLPAWNGISDERPGDPLRALEAAIERLQGVAFSLAELEQTVLPSRVPGYTPALLDQLGASGVVCWIGRGRLGRSGGRLALYLRRNLGALLDANSLPQPEPDTLEARIAAYLEQRGASFFAELCEACKPAAREAVLAALHDALWKGLITNDSFMPLRHSGALKPPAQSRSGRPPLARLSPNALARITAGRFALCRDLVRAPASPTEQAHARAALLLARYGIVTREANIIEELGGGFAAIYPVLEALEEAGGVQRGLFIEGLGGAQFAAHGAVERLRACAADRGAQALVLAAVDPAQPFGWALPWPGADALAAEAAPRRLHGARVVLVDGEPVLLLAASGKQLASFPAAQGDNALRAAVDALRAATRKPRALRFEMIDGQAARTSPLGQRLLQLGFAPMYRGIEG